MCKGDNEHNWTRIASQVDDDSEPEEVWGCILKYFLFKNRLK